MITREEFHRFMESYDAALTKENTINDVFGKIWDDRQGQHTPFYISEFREPLEMLFDFLWGIKRGQYEGSDLEWYYECLKNPEVQWWTDREGNSHDMMNVDDFYDFLVYNYGKTEKDDVA